ncbi:hypothetical protein N7540_000841 [Penicillium herquei]|nr:hypothetical protein N7540_000841 [Penicillium herquei]
MAPTFAGPLPDSFWSNDIPQVAHQEPAVLHAVVALSSLFEAFRRNNQASAPQKRFAIYRYSTALRQVVASEVQHMDSIAMVSFVFMGIELLLGN